MPQISPSSVTLPGNPKPTSNLRVKGQKVVPSLRPLIASFLRKSLFFSSRNIESSHPHQLLQLRSMKTTGITCGLNEREGRGRLSSPVFEALQVASIGKSHALSIEILCSICVSLRGCPKKHLRPASARSNGALDPLLVGHPFLCNFFPQKWSDISHFKCKCVWVLTSIPPASHQAYAPKNSIAIHRPTPPTLSHFHGHKKFEATK